MFEFVMEGVKKLAESGEGIKRTIENRQPEPLNRLEGDFREIPAEETGDFSQELSEPSVTGLETVNEAGMYMFDDIGLSDRTKEFASPDYIDKIRAQNEKVDAVLSRQEEVLAANPSDLDFQRSVETLDRYKGTVFEHELKDALSDRFEKADTEQQLVQTEWGATKPDVVMRGALEEMSIGDLKIAKGEDLYIEAKCGSADYIRNEMGHMLQQVEGHGDNSLVVVTQDYLELSPDVRAQFEKQLAEKGSHLYVADVASSELSVGLLSSLNL